MLEWIIGLAITMVITIVTLDLLENDAIFDGDWEEELATNGLFPYEQIESFSCDTKVQFTELDRIRASGAAEEIQNLFGENPVECCCQMDPTFRITLAKELHQRFCVRFCLPIALEIEEFENGCCGSYCNTKRQMRVDVRYLLSNQPELVALYFDTILHEFRHAMQYAFTADPTYNQVPEEYRKRIERNLHPSGYLSFAENPELYYKQLCERDAKAFAAMVMQLWKGEKPAC